MKDDNTHVTPEKISSWSSHPQESRSSGPSFTMILLVLLAIAGVAYGGVKYIQKNPSKGSYKHF
jgi:hypothetical protein